MYATLGIVFYSLQCMYLKLSFTIAIVIVSTFASAQKIDSLYVNLYTDSLKKGTYNYINIDGKLSTGGYTPLDSTHIIFWASEGKFHGNSLWIDKDISFDKVMIKVSLRESPHLSKSFTIYIKKKLDDGPLITEEDVLKEMQNKSKTSKKKKN